MNIEIDEDVAVLAAVGTCASALAVTLSAVARSEKCNVLTLPARSVDAMLVESVYDKWFQDNLRFTQSSFRMLCTLFRPLRRAHPAAQHSFETRVAAMLYYLGSMGGFRETAHTFGVSKSWAVTASNELLTAIADDYQRWIHLPSSAEEWNAVQDAFELRAGVPLVCGAVDGTLIELARFEDYEGWYCRKGYPAVNLQAVVDPRQRFISLDMRPGSWSDKKIWSASYFGQHIDAILPPGGFIVRDQGYTLSNALIIPYETYEHELDLSAKERNCNFNHSRTRIVVECTFATWKNRFRILRRPQEAKSVNNISSTIVASMVLHNIAIAIADATALPNPMDEVIAQAGITINSERCDNAEENALRMSSADGTESKTRAARERRQRGLALRKDIADYLSEQ